MSMELFIWVKTGKREGIGHYYNVLLNGRSGFAKSTEEVLCIPRSKEWEGVASGKEVSEMSSS